MIRLRDKEETYKRDEEGWGKDKRESCEEG